MRYGTEGEQRGNRGGTVGEQWGNSGDQKEGSMMMM